MRQIKIKYKMKINMLMMFIQTNNIDNGSEWCIVALFKTAIDLIIKILTLILSVRIWILRQHMKEENHIAMMNEQYLYKKTEEIQYRNCGNKPFLKTLKLMSNYDRVMKSKEAHS